MIRIRSDLAHAWPGRSFHLHSENTRCGTGVQRHGRRRFPVSEISCYFSDEPAWAVRCTGRTPVRDRVHVGSPIAGVRVTVPRTVRLLRCSPGSESGSMTGMAARSAGLRSHTKWCGLSAAGVFSSSPRNGKDRPALCTPIRSRDERREHPNRSYRSAHPRIRTSRRPHGELYTQTCDRPRRCFHNSSFDGF
jgi:hypothetical protein